MGYIKNLISNAEKSCAVDERTSAYVHKKMQQLDDYCKQFSDRHNYLCSHEFDLLHCQYFKNDPYLEIKDVIAQSHAELQSWLLDTDEPSICETQSDQRTIQQFLNQQAFQTQHILRAATKIQAIPPISIPKFSGRHEDWESFKHRFEAAVVNKTSYTDGIKLQYLLDAVQESALDMLRGVKPEAAYFLPSWQKLCRRYDNLKRRLTAHTLSLINLKAVTEKSASKLNELLDKAEKALQGFKDLNCPIEQYDTWLVHCVVNKLDPRTRESWQMNQIAHEGFFTYADLRSFIENRIYALDAASAHTAAQLSASSAGTSNSKYRN